MHMPPELKQAIDAAHGAPVEITDGQRQYVVIPADVFERLRSLVEVGNLSGEERAALLRQAGERAGWNDSDMDVYNDLTPDS